MRGHAPIHCRIVNPRAYYVPARGENTKLHPSPLELLVREINRGGGLKIPRESI